ncbi:MAG: hypothetical protein U0Q18_03185 [Bryobacteraceae bacterium]
MRQTWAVTFLLFGVVPSAYGVTAQSGPVFVRSAFGGIIFGYDIDQNGTEGLLSEALDRGDGTVDIAVETFDQTSGRIVKVVARQTMTHNNFVTFGIYGNSVGLVELEKSKGIFVNQRLYGAMYPVDSNQFTGQWTPPLANGDLILGMAPSQGSPSTAVLASHGLTTFIFGTNVAANAFGPVISLTNPIFSAGNSPVFALDTLNNQAVVAASVGAPLDRPTIAEVDLTTGNIVQFTGTGLGYVNGIAVDPADGIACTSSEIDFGLEFYDLAARTGFRVPLHNATNQSQSGGYVQFDPVNRLFLIGQEFSSTAPAGSSIQIFDPQGHFIRAINGLSLPASPAYIALNPSRRIGYVIVTPALNQLQSFTY